MKNIIFYMVLTCSYVIAVIPNGQPPHGFSITLRSLSPNSIYISWETKTKPYRIYRLSQSTEEYEYLATVYNDNSYIDTNLSPATKYVYKISYLKKYNKTEHYIAETFFAVTQPYIIAHRGYWLDVAGSHENSIKSLKLAAELGVYGSEFDVHLTIDNVAIVYHDSVIQGREIQFVSYDDIKNIVLANGERLPTLENYLQAGGASSIKLILEIKPHGTPKRDREAAQIVVNKVKEFKMEDNVEYITFSLDIGKELIRLSPDSKIGYLYYDEGYSDKYLAPYEAKNYGFSILSIGYPFLLKYPEHINEAINLGLSVGTWTPDQLPVIEDLVEKGVAFITTNRPLMAKEHFEQKVWLYHF
jgi:glycerophosphoryl diester phosphodiesterase